LLAVCVKAPLFTREESVTNATLLARRKTAIPRGVSHATSLFAARADNAEIWDVEGRRYVDFAGGIAVLNTGHRHPKVIAAVEKQLRRYTHTAFQVMPYEPYIELCEKLNQRAPIGGQTRRSCLRPAPRRPRTR
jgi:4-aminobutyrate aminotransferase/(S)-3-amino-2-methylpropionate transaminase